MRLLKKIVHTYEYRLSLRQKMLITHMIVTIIPALLITYFAYNQMVAVTTNTTLHSLNTLADQTRANIATTVDQLELLSENLCNDDFFSAYVRNKKPEIYENTTNFSSSVHNFENIIANCVDNTLVSNIRIYLDDAHYNTIRTRTDNTVFDTLSPARGTYWHGIFSSTDDTLLLCPPRYLSPTETDTLGSHAIVRKIQSSTSECFVVIYFNQSTIQPILLQDLPYNNSVIYIINSRNEIVASTNTMLSGTYSIPYEEITTRIPSASKQTRLQFAGASVYCGYKQIPGTDWRMVSVVPESNLTSEGSQLVVNFMLLYACVLIICIIISQRLSSSVSKRIATVAENMQHVKESALPVPMEAPDGSDEICSLIDSYNYMSDEINRLMQEQAKTAAELKSSEFRALQAQINPHFLYNTLDMINWMARSGETKQVSEAVNLLSRFYRITLSRGSSIITVREELEHVTLYVQLQNMRFNDGIHFFVDVPDEMLEHMIPKLVFQPIVENSILHGILEKPVKEGTIVLMGWMEEATLVFVITDDGVGIAPEVLSTILTGSHNKSHGNNIAISNTHKRIQLCYGSNYGLCYRSTPGKETEVEIRIPADGAPALSTPQMLMHHT